MKNFKRKYEFETNVPVPGIEEIMKVATDFNEQQEEADKPEAKKSKFGRKDNSLKLDKGLSSMRSQMMMLAEAVAEDEVIARIKNDTEVAPGSQEKKETVPVSEDAAKGD